MIRNCLVIGFMMLLGCQSVVQPCFVGMASAGKDTESCQWFITHSPTPYLDGRYTIFAKVTEGMEVVHQLEIGDKLT